MTGVKQERGEAPLFSDAQLAIVGFCAIECELQASGERSVHHMVHAWHGVMAKPTTEVHAAVERE